MKRLIFIGISLLTLSCENQQERIREIHIGDSIFALNDTRGIDLLKRERTLTKVEIETLDITKGEKNKMLKELKPLEFNLDNLAGSINDEKLYEHETSFLGTVETIDSTSKHKGSQYVLRLNFNPKLEVKEKADFKNIQKDEFNIGNSKFVESGFFVKVEDIVTYNNDTAYTK